MANSEYEYVKREFEFDRRLPASNWIVVRIDGCHFHRFSKIHAFEKPNDESALRLMNTCAASMLEKFPDIVFAYGVSDEYSFVFREKTEFYQRRESKILSLCVSYFTSVYVMKWKDFFPNKELREPPYFDGRVVCYPNIKTIRDYLAWRQVDCHINNHYNTCFWMLVKSGKTEKEAQQTLKGTFSKDKNELLSQQFHINYDDEPAMFRKGSSVYRDKTLSAADLRDPEISAIIAFKLREFHSLDMPGPKSVLMWDRLRNWLKTAMSVCPSDEAKEFRLDSMESEITTLENEISGEDQCIGFCHNDLQNGNIMIDEETKLLTIIDYEYASFNPVAYDIANHFCEMATDYHSEKPHILDYTKYPDFDEQKRFVQTYLSSSGEEPDAQKVKDLMKSIDKYALASHLVWGLWGIISEHVNDIDFDYMEYARQRFAQYWLKKHAILTCHVDE